MLYSTMKFDNDTIMWFINKIASDDMAESFTQMHYCEITKKNKNKYVYHEAG